MTKLAMAINQAPLHRLPHLRAAPARCRTTCPMACCGTASLTEGCERFDSAEGDVSEPHAHLSAAGVPALREPGVPSVCAPRAPLTKTTRAAWRSTTTSASAAACAWPPAPTTPASFNWNEPVRDPGAGLRRCPRCRCATRGVMEKCTLCKERTDRRRRAHVRAACCPADARIFGDLDDPESPTISRVRPRARGACASCLEEQGTRPQVFYIG